MGYTTLRMVAVLVTCNRLDQLKHSLARWLEAPPEVLSALLVADNASRDGTAAFLQNHPDPRVIPLLLTENRGGAGGFAAGMRAAAERFDPDWMLLSDDDAWPEAGALAAFAAFAAEEGAGDWQACAAAVFTPEGQICGINRPVYDPFRHPGVFLRSLLRGRAGFHLPDRAYAPGAAVRAVDGASFVGFFLSRAGCRLAGWPDPALFLYADDALYTLGLSRAGGRIAFLPGVRFTHDFRSLSAGRRMQPLWRLYYYHRNLLRLYRRCAGPLFWPALVIVLPAWLLRIRHYAGQRRRFLHLMRHALADGLSGRPGRSHAAVLELAGEPAPDPAAPPQPGSAPADPSQRLSRST